MIKSLAKIFEFQEGSISPNKLRNIIIMMIISLPTWPLIMMDFYDLIPDGWLAVLSLLLIVIGSLSMVCFVCTRFVNRFYFPDKYLDEWEKSIKHRSMSFAFMILVWIVAPVFLLVVSLTNISINFSSETFGLWFMGLLLSLLYLQTFHALWQVKPIDEDELAEPVKKSRAGLYVFVGAVLVFFGVPFSLGFISGYSNALEMGELADQAKLTCESRGSDVHWVSTDKENYGFACFDENREAPDNLK